MKLNDCEIYDVETYPNGYGRVKIDGRYTSAHRAKWIEANGEIPEGQVLIHLCGNKACVNLEHLCLGMKNEVMQFAFELRRIQRAEEALGKAVCKKEPQEGHSQYKQ